MRNLIFVGSRELLNRIRNSIHGLGIGLGWRMGSPPKETMSSLDLRAFKLFKDCFSFILELLGDR